MENDSASNFVLDYKILLVMQLLEKGLCTIAMITRILGMWVSLGNSYIWKNMMCHLSEAQVKVAEKVCEKNLEKEIAE